MTLSKGDPWAIGCYCHTGSFHQISPFRSNFPTSNVFFCLQARIVGGLFLSSQRYDSLFSHLLEINYRRKPPWILHSINHSPVSFFFSPIFDSYRKKFVSTMSDKLRQSVPDLTLYFIDASLTLPPVIEFCAASVDRFNLVATTVYSRKQHLSALISLRIWGWGLADVSVGLLLRPVKFRFKFRNGESMNWDLHRDLWPFNVWMVTPQWWFPHITAEARMLTPYWIRINGTSSLYPTIAMVRFAGFKIGLIFEVDFEAYVHNTGIVSVRMFWNCDNLFRFRRNSQFSVGENTFISLHCARLRNFCSKCGFLQLDVMECVLIHELFTDHQEEFSFLLTIDEALTLLRWPLDFWVWILVSLGLQVVSNNGTSDFQKRKHLPWQQIWVIGQRRLSTDQCESFQESSNVLISTMRQDTVSSTTTLVSLFKSKVMPKAFWSLSYKLLANNKYVKGGNNRLFHLLAWQTSERIAWLLSTLSSKLFQFPIFAYNGCIVLVLYFVNSF